MQHKNIEIPPARPVKKKQINYKKIVKYIFIISVIIACMMGLVKWAKVYVANELLINSDFPTEIPTFP